jgi:Ca2+-binding EF-hand superfamily protein
MRFGQFIVGLTACALWTNGLTVARGHDGHDHTHHSHASGQTDTKPVSRTWKIGSWTVSRTPTTVEASLLTAENDQVKLQTTDGRVVAVSTQVLTPDDLEFVQQRQEQILQLNTQPVWQLTAFRPQGGQEAAESPTLASFFKPFAKDVKVRWDRDFLFVESTGMPAHPMMTGITAWQQQVPLPQSYTGNNAWRIPLHPVPAKNPMSTKEHFFRGAIALAVNGVPIFNPIKNDGKTDTLKAGELDQWGGHCGRADDYHYHIAPVHLEKIVGAGNPVAVALDGYPIYGYNDPNGKPPTNLDWLNGHKGPDGEYHYHATNTFPYLNGGFYGEVVELNGQVDPQPRAQGVRPSLPGLKGAKIVGFERPKPGSFIVRYEVFGDPRSVEYTVATNGSATFNFVSTQGTKTENYTPRQGGGGDGRRNAERPTGNEPQGNRGRGEGGGRPDGGRAGGDPIVAALDVNGDGKIDKAELREAAAALRKLDTNKDSQITADELRGPGGQRRGGEGGGPRGERPPGQAGGPNIGGPKGPQPGDGPRQPWILVHADEIDIDKNKIISRDEIVGEATKAFAGYDANNDDKLSAAELNGRGGSRSAMGGFLKGHSKEIDRDGDGILTRSEAVGNAERMFAKMDTNGDGRITPDEMKASRRE